MRLLRRRPTPPGCPVQFRGMGGAVLHELTGRVRGAGCGPVRSRPRRGGERSPWHPAPSSLWRTAGGAAARRRAQWCCSSQVGLWLLMPAIGSPPAPTPTSGSPADSLRQAPAFPIRCATGLGTERGAGDVDGEHRRGVRDHELAHPLGQRGAAGSHRVLGDQRPLKRAPLRVREADKDAMAAGVGNRGAPGAHDFLISGSRLPVQVGGPATVEAARWRPLRCGLQWFTILGRLADSAMDAPRHERRTRTAPRQVPPEGTSRGKLRQ
jgi:hypothetical protein